jgi:thiamine biosynthesis lipoprotein
MQMQVTGRHFHLLGGTLEAVLYGTCNTERIFSELEAEARRLQKIFDFFDASSELSMLNENRSLIVSRELSDAVAMCLPYCALTGGAYDISLGRQISQRKKGLTEMLAGCSYRDVRVTGNKITLKHPDAFLDLGSMAKGYIGDMLAVYLRKRGVKGAYLDLRGDMVYYGGIERIAIQHPRKKDEAIYSFEHPDAGIASSGDYRQHYGAFHNSHIINSKDLCSVTVIADTLAEAELLSSCIYVTGTAGLTQYSGKKYYCVDDQMSTYKSEAFP